MNKILHEYAKDIGAIVPADEVGPQHFYYDGTRYYFDVGDKYIPVDRSSVLRHLKGTRRYSPDAMEMALNEIQRERYVKYAGPLAGHQRGLHEYGGDRLLATSSPILIQPSGGDWPTVRSVLEGLLGNDDEAGDHQIEVLLGWLKTARESLVKGKSRPGQALVIAGPPRSGKTLLIQIIEQVLGGRSANPYPNFSGRTSFNADLAGAELLVIDDEAGSTDIRARRALATSIKSSLFTGMVRIEGKHRDAFSFRPFWRMVIACNDEPEALTVLPPVTEDISDKLIFLRCHRRKLPMPNHSIEEREALVQKLMEELPAMLAFLEAMEIKEDCREERCGVKYFHHPVILGALAELAPETNFLTLVDILAEAGDLKLPWTGSATDLRSKLMESPLTHRDAEPLLKWLPNTGTYLGRLVGERVEKLTIVKGIQRWKINPAS